MLFVLLGRKWRIPGLTTIIAVCLILSGFGYLQAGWINNGVAFASIAFGALYAASSPLQRGIACIASPVPLTVAATVVLVRPLLFSMPLLQNFLNLLVPFATGAIFFGSFRVEGFLGRVIRSRSLQTLGLISYSLYLWQQLFTFNIENYPQQVWFSFPVLVFAVAAASFLFVERPMIRIGHALSKTIKQRAGHDPTESSRVQLVLTPPKSF